MLPDSDQFMAHPPVARSRVRSGSSLFVAGGDRRTAAARRFRDLMAAHTAELGHEPSEAEASIIRRASALEVQLEQLEAAWAKQSPTTEDLEAYSRLSNTLRRHLEAVRLGGRERRARRTLAQYLPSNRHSPNERSRSPHAHVSPAAEAAAAVERISSALQDAERSLDGLEKGRGTRRRQG
jgi:hypothetical protein